MKTITQVGTVLAGLFFLVAVGLSVLAIWTVGPDSGRWAGCAFIAVVLAVAAGFIASVAAEEDE